MTIQDVRCHSLWRTLNAQERLYLEALAGNGGDEELAAKTAYRLNPQSVKAMANKLRKRPVLSFLAQALAGSAEISPEEYRHYVVLLLRTTRDERIKAKMLVLYGELSGAGKSRPARPVPQGNPPGDDLADFEEG